MATCAPGIDPAWLALSRLRRRRLDASIAICDSVLQSNPFDLAVWYVKVRSLTNKMWIDESEVDSDGIGDALLDSNAVQKNARPGTSLSAPTGNGSGPPRPMSSNGRPMSGFGRPSTAARPATGSVEAAFGNSRPGTSRPVTSSGRFVRLGTASLKQEPGGPFLDIERMDLNKYVNRPPLARVLAEYCWFVDRNVRKCHELCELASRKCKRTDWWWEQRLGKCYFALSMMRDAEEALQNSLKLQPMLSTHFDLAKVFLKIDQPINALRVYAHASESASMCGDTFLLLQQARVHEDLGDNEQASQIHKRVLQLDSSSVEAIASLGAYQFYCNQPELALRYYRRLLQTGEQSVELWNNVGLCCFYAGQYDFTLACFERALQLADDQTSADVWYNISHLAVGMGDATMAKQALTVATSVDTSHAESLNNLGVLEVKRDKKGEARDLFLSAQEFAPHNFEPSYNIALLAYKAGQYQESFRNVEKALSLYPQHTESLEMLEMLKKKLAR